MKRDIISQVQKKKKVLRILAALTAIPALSVGVFAATNNWNDTLPTGGTGSTFVQLRTDLQSKIGGNLGKSVAMLGFFGTFISYLVSHKGSTLLTGAVISLIAGGLVGIIGTFFNAGTKGFN